ncbi:MAG: A/G-specific adenine glycosylase, partial [Bacteroidota bacterium]
MPKAKRNNRKSTVTQLVLRWYRRHGRPLPWRRTRSPYRILVSEIMLQQTQVGRVLEKYPSFLRRFPDIQSLARAKKSSVIKAWRGMGYNNRAVRLQQLARIVRHSQGGKLPRTVEELQNLPGIGRYTAHALACFAFRRPLQVVDTNVRRILSRLFPSETKRRDVWDVAAAI